MGVGAALLGACSDSAETTTAGTSTTGSTASSTGAAVGTGGTSGSSSTAVGTGGSGTAVATTSAGSGGPVGAGGSAGGASGVGGAGGNAGAGGSGGSLDAGAPDVRSDAASGGSPDGGSASCVTAGSELCDDFESGPLDTQKWKLNKPTGSATIVVDQMHAHSGQNAVHIKVVPNTQSTAMITESVTFPATQAAFYSRMWVYFSPDIPVAQGLDFHTGFMFGTGKNDKGDVQAGMGMIGSAKQYLGYSIFFGAPKFEFGPWSKTLIVANQWVCVELFENGNDPTTEVRQVWVNDVELTDLKSSSATAGGTQNPNHLPPKFDGVAFGLWEYHPIPTLSDMWIDDVRVSSKKIGCAN